MKNNLKIVIWFTGLSGSGKSTLANLIHNKFKQKKYICKRVDGDIFRKKRKNENKFSRIAIIKNNQSIIDYVDSIKNKYDFVIISVISPIKSTRLVAKNLFGKKYVEVYTKCKISNLIRRDTKGLYKLANDKKIKNLIGYKSNISYEHSRYKKIVLYTDKEKILESYKKLVLNLRSKFNVKV
tara:strand:- start:1029 stop:1574 length:546 start_codon:yes stop_codon:yes gene_type:complete